MKLLQEIRDTDFGFEEIPDVEYVDRPTARAVLLDEEGRVSVQWVWKHRFHKLPGGGVKKGETIEEGLRREIREEIGCEIEIGEEIGMIVEYRSRFAKKQIDYCYFAKVAG